MAQEGAEIFGHLADAIGIVVVAASSHYGL